MCFDVSTVKYFEVNSVSLTWWTDLKSDMNTSFLEHRRDSIRTVITYEYCAETVRTKSGSEVYAAGKYFSLPVVGCGSTKKKKKKKKTKKNIFAQLRSVAWELIPFVVI